MGLAANQARLNVLTARKSDLELRLTLIVNQNLKLATEKGIAANLKATAINEYVNNNQDEDVKFEDTQAFMDYEKMMDEIEAADLRLTQQQQTVETELAAISAEKEEIEKLVDSNIEDSFGYFN